MRVTVCNALANPLATALAAAATEDSLVLVSPLPDAEDGDESAVSAGGSHVLFPFSLLYQNGRFVFGSVILVHGEEEEEEEEEEDAFFDEVVAFEVDDDVDVSGLADAAAVEDADLAAALATGLSHCDLPSLLE